MKHDAGELAKTHQPIQRQTGGREGGRERRRERERERDVPGHLWPPWENEFMKISGVSEAPQLYLT
jgi:hypothetical protein